MLYGLHRLITLGLFLAGIAAGSACSHPANNPGPEARDFSSRQKRAPGEYLVTLAPGADTKVIVDLYGRYGIKGIRDLGGNLFLVMLTEDPCPEHMDELRRQNDQVKAVQPNFVYRAN